MPNPTKPNRPINGGKASDDSEAASNNLWVGNLSADVTDSDLMSIFGKYGALDSITLYASRNYAFIYFKHAEDAKAARDALQGTVVQGIAIKIEFARPAKPCRQLWVSGINPSVTKEKLEEEFLKFGKIEGFKFLKDRNTAYVEYVRLEDASQAMKCLNGKQIGGGQIRVDFFRSQYPKREQGPDFHDPRDKQFFNRGFGPSDAPSTLQYSGPTHSGPKRHHSQSSGVRRGDGPPSKVLWVGYPPSFEIDEQLLHNAMILFGEIERIKSFPSRHYSFVEFRSVDEARRAKEGLQGKLFAEPRISIKYSSSEFAPGKDYPGFYSGGEVPRPDMFYNEFPPTQMDIFNRPMVPDNFPGPLPLPSNGVFGPNMMMRRFGPQGSLEPLLSGPEFNESASNHNMQEFNPNNLMGPNWRRPSPVAPGMLPSPSPGIRPSIRPMSGAWDAFDTNQFQRESKRSRMDGSLPIDNASLQFRKIDRGLGMDQQYALGPHVDGGAPSLLANVQGKNRLSPVGTMAAIEGPSQGHHNNDFIWRGIIAKGGTPVCHARCVPIGKGIESELPEVVNCSARTGLEMLEKHFAEANGYDIVFFLPDSEEDFASYTEFLRYLGEKNRAGVAKLDDGTTLFLVPPSDFLTDVLNVVGPERLYGVVLRLPHVPSGATAQQPPHQPLPSSQFNDRPHVPLQNEYCLIPQREDRALHMDYNKGLNEDPPLPVKPHFPSTSESLKVQHVSQDYASVNTAAVSQAGVALTPELIATLASLLPANTHSSALESAQQPLGSSNSRTSFPVSVTPDIGIPSQGWKHDHRSTEQTSHPSQQFGNQFNPHPKLPPQLQSYQPVSNNPTHSAQMVNPSHSAQMVLASTEIQDQAFNLPHQFAVSSRPLSKSVIPSQNGQFAVPQQVHQQYQLGVPQSGQKGYGMVRGTDAPGFYGSPVFQQPKEHVNLASQVHGANFVQPQTVLPLTAEKVNSEHLNQVQQLQSAVSGGGQGTSDAGVDKNQQYQSTLQLAANLLFQIQQQQQQQQRNTNAGQGSGNQQ